MPKAILRHCVDGRKEYDMLWFWCPACEEYHAVRLNHPDGYNWTWNGNQERPTISPSILVHGTKPLTDSEVGRILRGEHIDPTPTICHSFVTDGKIQYLQDCTHDFADETIELPEEEL